MTRYPVRRLLALALASSLSLPAMAQMVEPFTVRDIRIDGMNALFHVYAGRGGIGLISNPFHVGDHFQCCGNLPQVPSYRLLKQQKLKAKRFYFTFHLFDLRF